MSISKEIFGIERKTISENTGVLDSEYCYGFNDALDSLDQHELSEEELSNIIQNAGADWENLDDPITPLYVYIAKAIIKNKSKIFVRKSNDPNSHNKRIN